MASESFLKLEIVCQMYGIGRGEQPTIPVIGRSPQNAQMTGCP